MFASYKVGSAWLATCIVEYSILHPLVEIQIGRIDNTKTEILFISEHDKNEEAEFHNVIDEGDELYSYEFLLVRVTK